jgi:hypothetical protein
MAENTEIINEKQVINQENAENEQNSTEYLLPGGYLDSNGVLHKEVEISEITGKDEEAISNPNIAKNSGKILTALLKGTVKRIGSIKNPDEHILRKLLIGDRDYLILKIRQITFGDEYIKKSVCPNCGHKFEIKINLNDIEIKEFSGNWEIPFELKTGYKDKDGKIHKKGILKLPTGVEQEYLSASNMTGGQATTALLTNCCIKLGTLPAITTSVIRELTLRDRQLMAKLLVDNMPGPIFEAENICPACEHIFKENLLMADFFLTT